MSIDDPTPLSQYGAAALLAVLVQSLRNRDLPEPISPLVLVERMIDEMRHGERKWTGDEEAISALTATLRYLHMAEQMLGKE